MKSQKGTRQAGRLPYPRDEGLDQNLLGPKGLQILHAIGILIDQGAARINGRKQRLIPDIDKERVEPGKDRHGDKGPVDQFSSRKSHAHIARSADDVGFREVRS